MSRPGGFQGARPRPATRGLWRAAAGWALWAVTFSMLYAGHALGCRMAAGGPLLAPLHAPPLAGAVAWGLGVVWALCIAGHGVLLARSLRRAREAAGSERDASDVRPLANVTWVMDACAMAATVVTGLPVMTVAACTP